MNTNTHGNSNVSPNYKKREVELPTGLSSVIRRTKEEKNSNLKKQTNLEKEIMEMDKKRIFSKLDKLIAEEEREAQEIEVQRNKSPPNIFKILEKKKRELDSDSNSDSDSDSDSDSNSLSNEEIYSGYESDSDKSVRQCWEDEMIRGYNKRLKKY